MEMPSVTNSDDFSLNNNDLDVSSFVKTLFTEKTLPELVDFEKKLVIEIKEYNSQMRSLVYENYNKFLQSKKSIGEMGDEFISLLDDIKGLQDEFSVVRSSMLDLKEKVSPHSENLLELLSSKKQMDSLAKYQKLLETLENFKINEDYMSLVMEYINFVSFLRETKEFEVYFESIKDAAYNIANESVDKLVYELTNINCPNKSDIYNILKLFECDKEKLLTDFKHHTQKRLKVKLEIIRSPSMDLTDEGSYERFYRSFENNLHEAFAFVQLMYENFNSLVDELYNEELAEHEDVIKDFVKILIIYLKELFISMRKILVNTYELSKVYDLHKYAYMSVCRILMRLRYKIGILFDVLKFKGGENSSFVGLFNELTDIYWIICCQKIKNQAYELINEICSAYCSEYTDHTFRTSSFSQEMKESVKEVVSVIIQMDDVWNNAAEDFETENIHPETSRFGNHICRSLFENLEASLFFLMNSFDPSLTYTSYLVQVMMIIKLMRKLMKVQFLVEDDYHHWIHELETKIFKSICVVTDFVMQDNLSDLQISAVFSLVKMLQNLLTDMKDDVPVQHESKFVFSYDYLKADLADYVKDYNYVPIGSSYQINHFDNMNLKEALENMDGRNYEFTLIEFALKLFMTRIVMDTVMNIRKDSLEKEKLILLQEKSFQIFSSLKYFVPVKWLNSLVLFLARNALVTCRLEDDKPPNLKNLDELKHTLH